MTDLRYPACIRQLYEGEIFGEAAALALLRVAESARDRYHLGTFLQLETETKARLRPFLAKHGVDLAEEMELGDLDALVNDYRENGLHAFLAHSIAVVEDAIARFGAIARVCPDDEDREIVLSMIAHEESILRWMRMERDGPAEGSLDAMIAQLRFPLPRP